MKLNGTCQPNESYRLAVSFVIALDIILSSADVRGVENTATIPCQTAAVAPHAAYAMGDECDRNVLHTEGPKRPPTALPNDYVSWWRFEEDARDEMGANDGQLRGSAKIVEDLEKGGVLRLDGTEGCVLIPDDPTLDLCEQITLCAWVKPSLMVGVTKIVVKPTETGADPWELYALDLKEAEGVRFVLSDGTSYAQGGWHAVRSPITLNEWHHVVGSYDGSIMRLYLDNTPVASRSVGTVIGDSDADVLIGRWVRGSFFDGLVDDVMISALPLSGAQIARLYDEQSPRSAQEPWIGLLFSPAAHDYLRHGRYTNYDHGIFLDDYRNLLATLADLGFNTIVLDLHYYAYHYTFDPHLDAYGYHPSRGFTCGEMREMARMAREQGMRVMLSLQILTHQDGGVLSAVYPECMLPEPAWISGASYSKVSFTQIDGTTYQCIAPHVSDITNRPGSGIVWSDYWITSHRRTRDPFDEKGESLTFSMIDELIDACTIDGIEPDGFHIASDELRNWLQCPQECEQMSSSELFAKVITDVYDHIKKDHPELEVVMWGDMLDPAWNGGQMDTAGAISMIPKDIVIADWRYETDSSFGYNFQTETFPSIGMYVDHGFRVWPAVWRDMEGAEALIRTANAEAQRSGRVVGILYTTWMSYVVPGLGHALLNEPDGWQDLVPPDIELYDRPVVEYLEEMAQTVSETVGLIERGAAFPWDTDLWNEVDLQDPAAGRHSR